MENYARSARLPPPAVAGWAVGLWLIVGGLSIALGPGQMSER
jgi:uncharacterized membrane protein YphA (DoxX/SURF4 family)